MDQTSPAIQCTGHGLLPSLPDDVLQRIAGHLLLRDRYAGQELGGLVARDTAVRACRVSKGGATPLPALDLLLLMFCAAQSLLSQLAH